MVELTGGVFPPIVTPFDKNDEIDYSTLADHIARLEEGGVDGIIPCGSTGERATLQPSEHRKLIEFTVDNTAGPVIAGTGSSSTWETIELSKHAENVGADGVLVLAPYYSSPNQQHTTRHYETVANTIDIPLIIYNYPGGAGYNIKPETVRELANHPNIAGIKDSTGDIGQMNDLCEFTKDLNFEVLSGWDSLVLPGMSIGAVGVIGIIANLFPSDIRSLVDSIGSGELDRAQRIHQRIVPLEREIAKENPPITIKACLELLGYDNMQVRAPQYGISKKSKSDLKEALKNYQQ